LPIQIRRLPPICGKRGHIAKVCRSALQAKKSAESKKTETSPASKPVHQLSDNSTDAEYTLFPVESTNCKPLQTGLTVEGHKFIMEIDTGAVASLVSEDTMNSSPFLKCLPLQPTCVKLHTYIGEPVSLSTSPIKGQGPT